MPQDLTISGWSISSREPRYVARRELTVKAASGRDPESVVQYESAVIFDDLVERVIRRTENERRQVG